MARFAAAMMRRSRRVLIAVLVLVVAASLWSRMCRTSDRQAIRVDEGRVVVTNLTGMAWSDVDVWLNDFYRAQAPALAPDQRLEVPLGVFVAAYGRKFDAIHEAPVGIEVTARGADGRPITVTWGRGRRR